MELCEPLRCTGCGACVNACPLGCIAMIRDDKGFDRPKVDEGRCVDCGRCESACPQLAASRPFRPLSDQKVYMAALREDRVQLKRSSSGGIAYSLSREMIECGGVVYGVAYGDDMRVSHVRVEDSAGLARLQGSKYVQSAVGDSYRNVRKDLRQGRSVLFIGVGCQVDGLYRYLGDEDYANLYTVDLLCGGGTSPGVFECYIKEINRKYKSKIDGYNFRDKRYGYGYLICSMTDDGRQRILRGADAGFVRSMGAGYVRESCFECPYAKLNRVSDITLGDFWNAEVDENRFQLGTSLVLANSVKGLELIDSLGGAIWTEERTEREALGSQSAALRQGRAKPSDYEEFFHDAFELSWDAVYSKYLKSPVLKRELFDSIPAWLAAFAGNMKRKVGQLGK